MIYKYPDNQRLREFREYLNIPQGDFAESLNLKQGSYSDIERGRASLTQDVVIKLITIYNINTNWLYTGKGDKTLKDNQQELSTASMLYHLATPIKNHKINIQKSSFVLPFFESASAGYIVGWGDISVEEYYQMFSLSQHMEQLIRGFTVFGESMLPSLNKGDIVFCHRIIDRWSWSFNPHDMFVVLSREGLNIKYIKDDGSDTITLISENQRFREFKVLKDDVRELWVVESIYKNVRNGAQPIYFNI